MSPAAGPVLQALTQAAVDATGAAQGWMLQLGDGELVVVSAAGDDPGQVIGVTVAADAGSAGFVVSAGQPLAISPQADDPLGGEGVAASLGRRPTSLLCVPCGTEDAVLGVLELIDKSDGGRFTIDDVEMATLLGGIAGAALADGDVGVAPPAPAELSRDLAALANDDPARYATVAPLVAALLERG